MSDASEIGVVLANTPRIRRAFGPNRAMLITLVSLFLARPRPGILSSVPRKLGILGFAVSVLVLLAPYWG